MASPLRFHLRVEFDDVAVVKLKVPADGPFFRPPVVPDLGEPQGFRQLFVQFLGEIGDCGSLTQNDRFRVLFLSRPPGMNPDQLQPGNDLAFQRFDTVGAFRFRSSLRKRPPLHVRHQAQSQLEIPISGMLLAIEFVLRIARVRGVVSDDYDPAKRASI